MSETTRDDLRYFEVSWDEIERLSWTEMDEEAMTHRNSTSETKY